MTSARPVRAVVDTNLIVSALILKRGVPYALLQALYAGTFHLLLSMPMLNEYLRVLARPYFAKRYNLAAAEVVGFQTLLAERAVIVTPIASLHVAVRDAKDEMVLATTLGGAAEYLVSGDADLLTLAGDPRLGSLHIVTAREFLTVADQQDLQAHW